VVLPLWVVENRPSPLLWPLACTTACTTVQAVISGVPQESILGLLLFLIFINDIDKGIVNKLLKFADDTKLVSTVSSECEINPLRLNLKQLYYWSVNWQMLFNADKCKVLHFGYKNISNIYSLGDEVINAENEEKDLGVIVSDTLKPSTVVSVSQHHNQLMNLGYDQKNICKQRQ